MKPCGIFVFLGRILKIIPHTGNNVNNIAKLPAAVGRGRGRETANKGTFKGK
jgi:hypothetical protein